MTGRFSSVLLVFAAVFVAGGCAKSIADEDQMEFIMTMSDGKRLDIESARATDYKGDCLASFSSMPAPEVHTMRLALQFRKNVRSGQKIRIVYCVFGPIDVNIHFDVHKPSAGRILLKRMTDKEVVLRFEGVVFESELGEYHLNGDLSYATW